MKLRVVRCLLKKSLLAVGSLVRLVVPLGVPSLVPNDTQTGTASRPRGSMPLKRSQGHADTCASEHDPAPVPITGVSRLSKGRSH